MVHLVFESQGDVEEHADELCLVLHGWKNRATRLLARNLAIGEKWAINCNGKRFSKGEMIVEIRGRRR